MVLHPSGLKRGVLPVVAEHEEAPALGVMDHVLGEDMHVRDVDRAHGASRLAIVAAHSVTDGAAGQTARKPAGVLRVLLHGEQLYRVCGNAALPASVHGLRVGGTTVPAEVEGRRPGVLGCSFGVILADQVVDQNDALAALRLLQRWPPGAGEAGATATRPSAGIAEVFEERDVVVLAAGRARHHGKGLVVRARLLPIPFVLCGQRQPRSAGIFRKGRYGAADAAYESVDHGPQ